MLDCLRDIELSQKVKISKEEFYELNPNPPNSKIIALGKYLIKLKAEKNSYYATAISNYLRVKRVCILESSEHQIVLEFYEGDRRVEKSFPCSILDPKEIRALINFGILHDSCFAKELVSYLMQNMQKAPVVHYYNRLGWAKDGKGETFYLHKPIGANSSDNYEYCGDLDLSPKGSLEAWTSMVEDEVIGNIPLTFVLTLGFASPILALLNERYDLGSLLVSLSNLSSKGKSTAAALAASVYSTPKLNKGVMRSFYGTSNALSSIVSNCNGVLVALDEIALNNSSQQALESWLYAVCTGSSKQRLSGDSTLKAVKEFSTVILTTGEYSLLSDDSQGGLYARIFNIEDDLTADARNSDAIKATVLENYAVAGSVFISYLISIGVEEIYNFYDIVVDNLQAMVKVKSGLRDRAISKFALVVVTAHLVKECFGFKISGKKFNDYVVKLIEKSIVKMNPEETLLDIVTEEVAANRTKFAFNGNSSFGGCIGKIVEHKGCKDIYIAQTEFKNMMKKHSIHNYDKILDILKSKDILISEDDRKTTRKVLGTTRVVCYGFHIVNEDKAE